MTTRVSGDRPKQAPYDRVWTIPNALSMLRLVLIPVFLWLLVGRHYGWAIITLVVSGVSDYLDGLIARRFGSVTRLGQVLDPLADRAYILSTIAGLAVQEILPWWLVGVLVARDLIGFLLVQVVRRAGYRALPVHAAGKAATFCLLYAMPLILLAEWDHGWALAAGPLGWAFALWGAGLYWVSLGLYLAQTVDLLRSTRGGDAAGTRRASS